MFRWRRAVRRGVEFVAIIVLFDLVGVVLFVRLPDGGWMQLSVVTALLVGNATVLFAFVDRIIDDRLAHLESAGDRERPG